MRLGVNSEGGLLAKEVFNGLVLETAEGNMLTVCMRDDTVEMQVVGTGRWFRADMDTGEIYEMARTHAVDSSPAETERPNVRDKRPASAGPATGGSDLD